MNKKFFCTLLFLTLSLSCAAYAESDKDTADAVDEATVAEETAADDSAGLENGNGWKTVRIAELGNSGKKVHMVLVEQSRHTDKTIYSNAITRLCQGEDEFCRIRFWSNERFIPERAALTAEQNKQLKADYLVNKAAGIKELRWSCSVDPKSQNCLPN
ncbi:MAG: hypothetical protein LV471_03375 [Nitrosomonas sp.]|nr:hypothetical protein [Nitrosomonas sp.]